jgi:hypothetical protein
MKSRVPVLVLVVIVLAALPTHAEYRPVRGSVLVLLKSTTGTEDTDLKPLMLNVIRIEIEDRELEMVVPAALPPAGEQPLDSAKKAGAEFALTAAYTTSGKEVVVDLTWYETAAKTKSSTISRKSAVDFTFDVTMAAAVAQVLEAQKARILALPLKPDPNAAAVTPPGEVPLELGKDVVRLEPLKPILISLGAEPLIPTFSATDYIEGLWFGAKAAVAWRFPMLGGAGGLGVTVGFQQYDVSNVGSPGMFYALPIGLQVQYGTRMPGPLDFFVHFDGGGLLWTWDQTSENEPFAIWWYIAGGVGLVVDILKNFGIAVDITYSYYPLNPAFTFLEPAVLLLLKL